MKYLIQILRFITGILFIFSGLVKANDPLGLSYKMQEFFSALHVYALSPFALAISIVMITVEVFAGVAIIAGFRMRFTASLILILIIFFSLLTGYAYFSGKVKECGCFGDCIPMSAGVSFGKDLVLLAMIGLIFAYRNTSSAMLGRSAQWLIVSAAILVPLGVQWYALNHLPPVDCLPYAVGKNIAREMLPPPGAVPDRYTSVMIYEKNGRQKAFTDKNYPWKDTTWHFVRRQDKLVSRGNAIPVIADFALFDSSGQNLTSQILQDPHLIFLLLVRDVHEAGSGWSAKIDQLQKDCLKYHINIYGVTASGEQATDHFRMARHLDFPFLQMDATVIKTAARSNPCLILLSGGTVLGKWHYHDFPLRILSLDKQGIHLQH
ncbi:MAG TPA: BT_3928 family protein [Chitinophagaceae bacterium]|nr:BT_3928 family protein [Chitinophagaceae bacterium]